MSDVIDFPTDEVLREQECDTLATTAADFIAVALSEGCTVRIDAGAVGLMTVHPPPPLGGDEALH